MAKKEFYYDIMALHKGVTGSCVQVVVHYPDGRSTQFLVDCGIFQEKKYNELNSQRFPFYAENIEFVLVTHNHADHIGRIPVLYKEGYTGKIYATKATKRYMKVSLKDAYKNMKRDFRKEPLYSEEDLENALCNIESCEFGKTEYIDKNIKVTFIQNGHTSGAACINVQISYPGRENLDLVFTGDYKPENKFFDVEEFPEWLYETPLTVVTESTYGNMDTEEIRYHMESDIVSKINQGMTILIPILAFGRAQEVLFMLKSLQDRKVLYPTIPIGLDGNMAQIYTRMLQNIKLGIDPTKVDFLPRNLTFITKENRQSIISSKRQQIILCTSGMCDYGPIQMYLPSFLTRKDVVVYFCNYLSPASLGYKILNSPKRQVKIGNKTYKVRAELFQTNELSSHAKANELIDFLSKFKKLQMVLINHGEEDVQEQFLTRVESEVNTKRVARLGEYAFRINETGYKQQMKANLNPVQEKKRSKDTRFKNNCRKKKAPKLRKYHR